MTYLYVAPETIRRAAGMMVPTLVPKPGSSTVTQGNLPSYEIDELRALGLPWVMLDREICSLKIRV